MKKLFPLIGSLIIVCCAAVLHYSCQLSGKASWSLIVSSQSSSPWELYKPVGYVYIFFTFIELSALRPRLLHFVCSKAAGMYVLCLVSLFVSLLVRGVPEYFPGQSFFIAAAASVLSAQLCAYALYRSTVRIELLWLPLMISVLCMLFLLIMLSFCPPRCALFY